MDIHSLMKRRDESARSGTNGLACATLTPVRVSRSDNRLSAARHCAPRGHERMGINNKDPEALEIIMPSRRQRQTIANASTLLVRTGYHVKRKREVGSASRQGTQHCKIALAR